MKRFLSLFLVAAMLLSMSGAALADKIAGSKHDLSSGGANAYVKTGESQVCVFCHTPHNSYTSGPLWNRAPMPSAGNTYDLYASETFDGGTITIADAAGRVATAGSASDLCLSCHDGTISVLQVKQTPLPIPAADGTTGSPRTSPGLLSAGALGSAYNADGTLKAGRTANLGTNLKDDHPVGFAYKTSLTNEAARLGMTATDQLAGMTQRTGSTQWFVNGAEYKLPLFGVGEANAKLECDSCHNVHDPGATGHTSSMYPFLRAPMEGSKLCFQCHTK